MSTHLLGNRAPGIPHTDLSVHPEPKSRWTGSWSRKKRFCNFCDVSNRHNGVIYGHHDSRIALVRTYILRIARKTGHGQLWLGLFLAARLTESLARTLFIVTRLPLSLTEIFFSRSKIDIFIHKGVAYGCEIDIFMYQNMFIYVKSTCHGPQPLLIAARLTYH